jgi:adenine-specific DNA-methyltransferase
VLALMSRKKTSKTSEAAVVDYRHEAKRKNNPPAGLAAQGPVRDVSKAKYAYNPHLPPMLRFDQTGATDSVFELLDEARTRRLTEEETRILAEALRQHEPWLEWTGKREKKGFEVDPVALHIHERVSTQAILKIAKREDVQRALFADPQQDYREAIQFYQHDVDWSNRMILGDSLQVMASIARREDIAGKVQMIYIDPPYGIKFASNFQPEINKRDVKDKESDLTREPEMVKAYRDTWRLGVHSYLAYLRDRFILAKELLNDSGSIFVQISDENIHLVRSVLGEVFGIDNFCSIISFRKTTGQAGFLLPDTNDYLLWYAKNRQKIKFRTVFQSREGLEWVNYDFVSIPNGDYRKMLSEEKSEPSNLPDGSKVYRRSPLTSSSSSESTLIPVEFEGQIYKPGKGGWKTNKLGFERLKISERLEAYGITLSYRRFVEDFPYFPISNAWTDTASGGYGAEKIYVVQTNPKVIARCLLMTTDPGDLVLDPTCGSGTTAYVAEQWGRRWITIDSSRVALALARQRLLTAKFDYYNLRPVTAEDRKRNSNGTWLNEPSGNYQGQHTFNYKTIPHITLKSIAQNVALDPLFSKHHPFLSEKLAELNNALTAVTPELRKQLLAKLLEKEKRQGKKSVTVADRRRWLLPQDGWKEWEVPFDIDQEWPVELKNAFAEYRTAWRAKMGEVNACIEANAIREELVDHPEIVRDVVRVSGPFTMEAVMPAEESLHDDSPIEGKPEELDTFGNLERQDGATSLAVDEPINAEAYLDKMIRLLRTDGVRFPNNRIMNFTCLESCGGVYIHAEGEWEFEPGQPRKVAVSFGPQYGPVTGFQVESALPLAGRRGYDDLVFAGFSFDAAAQGIIQDDPHLRVRCHLAHIRPDVSMSDLLKETPNSQIFTVFGSPRTDLRSTDGDMFTIEMQGVDIYNPVDNTILPTSAGKVAAWFLDTDYDGRTFCITQAFFPDKNAWDKLQRALKGIIDEERFAALSGTVSLPFSAGKHRRAAVKVIDPRGNEVMRVHHLPNHKGARDVKAS